MSPLLIVVSTIVIMIGYFILRSSNIVGSNKTKKSQCRHFVVMCNKGPTSESDILLQDLKKCRVDLIARCISSALFTSHSIRNDTNISFFCANKNIITFGNDCKHLKPDERTLGAMIKHALKHGPLSLEEKQKLFDEFPKTKVLKGITVNKVDELNDHSMFENFSSFISTLICDNSKDAIFVITLTENGDDIKQWIDKISYESNIKFVILVGDSKDIEQQCLEIVKHITLNNNDDNNNIKFVDIKVGNISLLASHAIIIFHHYLDSYL